LAVIGVQVEVPNGYRSVQQQLLQASDVVVVGVGHKDRIHVGDAMV
jgi:hypothetical protein